MQNVYKNFEEYNSDGKLKLLIDFDDEIVDMISNKKPNQIVNEIFIREQKLKISTFFITQSHYTVSEDVRQNFTHFFILKIYN